MPEESPAHVSKPHWHVFRRSRLVATPQELCYDEITAFCAETEWIRSVLTMNNALFSYIAACPTAYHAVSHTASLLRNAGYQPLSESEDWQLRPGAG